MRKFLGWCACKGHGSASAVRGQPSPEQYEHCQVLWRGYLANRGELLAEAKRRGATLLTSGDGELFAQAYLWWGLELQARVLGEYAVAIFDQRSSSLLLTHDAMGILPLFYTQLPDRLIFAS